MPSYLTSYNRFETWYEGLNLEQYLSIKDDNELISRIYNDLFKFVFFDEKYFYPYMKKGFYTNENPIPSKVSKRIIKQCKKTLTDLDKFMIIFKIMGFFFWRNDLIVLTEDKVFWNCQSGNSVTYSMDINQIKIMDLNEREGMNGMRLLRLVSEKKEVITLWVHGFIQMMLFLLIKVLILRKSNGNDLLS